MNSKPGLAGFDLLAKKYPSNSSTCPPVLPSVAARYDLFHASAQTKIQIHGTGVPLLITLSPVCP